MKKTSRSVQHPIRHRMNIPQQILRGPVSPVAGALNVAQDSLDVSRRANRSPLQDSRRKRTQACAQMVPHAAQSQLTTVQLAPSATVFDFKPLRDTGSETRAYGQNAPTFEFVRQMSNGERYDLLGGAAPYQLVVPTLTQSGKYVLVVTGFAAKNVRWEFPFTIH